MYRWIIIVFVGLVAAWTYLADKDRFPQDGEPGPFPSDWFMLQRTWPETHLNADRVRQGAEHAARMRRSTLDEDPFWVQRGPTNIGGRVTDIAGHPTNDSIYYVASASGGVFKTVDGGRNYTAITDDLPTQSIGALAINPTTPEIVYCGTGEANSAGFSYFGFGVYKSVNGGQTWQPKGLEESRYISRIAIHPENPEQIWVAAMGELFAPGGQRGIFYSENGGDTWQQKLFVNDSTGASDVVLHPTNPDIVYAAMWQRVRTPEVRRVGGRWSGIYKTIDRGENWTRLSSGLPPIGENVGRIGLAISRSNPDVLYACYADDPGYFLGVFRSSDAGESWTRTNDSGLENMYSNFGWYFGNIRVRPDNEDMVFVLGVTLHRSENGGASWNEIGEDVHVDHHALWFDPQQSFRFLLGNDGGFYRTLNNGNSFQDLNNFPAVQYYAGTYDASQPHRLYGGTQDNGTLRSMTGAIDEYERIYGGDGFYTLVDPNNNNYVYAEYQYGGLGRSTDGGEDFSWALNGIDDSERRNWSTPVVFDPANSNTLYYGAQRLYKSTNRAQSWMAISPDLTSGPGQGNLVFGTITTIGISPANSNVIYVGTDDANVWVTTDGGENWTLRNTGLPRRWITRVTPHPTDANEALVTISGYRNNEQQAHLYRTTNQGETWVEAGASLPDVPLNDVLYDPQAINVLYAASDFGIFWSQNYGDSWAALGRGLPPVPTLDMILDNSNRKLIAATYGRSFVTLPLDSLGINRRPIITSRDPEGDPVVVTQHVPVTFRIAAEDPDGDSLRYMWRYHGEILSILDSCILTFGTLGPDCVSVDVSDGFLHTQAHFEIDVVLSSLERSLLPDKISVKAYPNPFNSATRISFILHRTDHVKLDIYTIDGRQAEVLIDGIMQAGEHEISWSPRELSSGIYFVRLKSNSTTESTKLHFIK